jgi:hypothetical protein
VLEQMPLQRLARTLAYARPPHPLPLHAGESEASLGLVDLSFSQRCSVGAIDGYCAGVLAAVSLGVTEYAKFLQGWDLIRERGSG